MKPRLSPLLLTALTLNACDRTDTRPTGSSPPNPPSTRDPGDRPTPPAQRTAGDQGQNADDVRITADIRRAIMEDKGMSVAAQNCTIVTDRGVVTLRGAVRSAEEKASIGTKAGAVAGVTRVDNQLEVKPD